MFSCFFFLTIKNNFALTSLELQPACCKMPQQVKSFALHKAHQGQAQSLLCVFCSKVHSRENGHHGDQSSGGPSYNKFWRVGSGFAERITWATLYENECVCVCV